VAESNDDEDNASDKSTPYEDNISNQKTKTK
jgi:hypothetical protein